MAIETRRKSKEHVKKNRRAHDSRLSHTENKSRLVTESQRTPILGVAISEKFMILAVQSFKNFAHRVYQGDVSCQKLRMSLTWLS